MWVRFTAMLFFLLLGAAGLSWPLLGRLCPSYAVFDVIIAWYSAAFVAFLAALGFYNPYKWLRIRGAFGGGSTMGSSAGAA